MTYPAIKGDTWGSWHVRALSLQGVLFFFGGFLIFGVFFWFCSCRVLGFWVKAFGGSGFALQANPKP